MQKVTFTNAVGETIELYRRPFFLSKVEGLGDVDANIHSINSPGLDGVVDVEVVMEPRYIPMEVDIIDDHKVNQRILSKVFNPKLGCGKLIYENGYVKVGISAIPEHAPKIPDTRPIVTKKATIDMMCPSPYWEDLEYTVVNQDSTPTDGTSFPLTLPTSFPTTDYDYLVVENNGDVETPVILEITGPADNVIINNETTGESINVISQIRESYKLVINTDPRNRKVDYMFAGAVNKADAYDMLNIDSDFFQLAVGVNKITVYTGSGADQGLALDRLNIKYKQLYIGV